MYIGNEEGRHGACVMWIIIMKRNASKCTTQTTYRKYTIYLLNDFIDANPKKRRKITCWNFNHQFIQRNKVKKNIKKKIKFQLDQIQFNSIFKSMPIKFDELCVWCLRVWFIIVRHLWRFNWISSAHWHSTFDFGFLYPSTIHLNTCNV